MKLLFATDGSEYSEGAAKFLTKLNFSSTDEISVFHVITWAPIISEWETLYTDLRAIREDIVPKILSSSEEILSAGGAKIHSSFTEGYPDKAIIEKAEETGCDLLVMGARGLRGIGSRIVGSVTKLVAIHAKNPVLIIKPPQWNKAGKTRILFATDGSAHSEAMEKTLAHIPFPDDTEITVLNVVTPALSDIPERFALEISDRVKNIVAKDREKEHRESEEKLKRARENLQNKYASIEGITKFGDPSEEIIRAAEEINADIIAVGSSGMRGIKGVLGSVSRYVLNHSECSVLVGKI